MRCSRTNKVCTGISYQTNLSLCSYKMQLRNTILRLPPLALPTLLPPWPSAPTYGPAGQTTTTTTILNECKILTKIQIAFVFVGNVYIFTQSTAIITVGAWGEKRLSFPLLMKLAQQQRHSLPGRTNSQNGTQERYFTNPPSSGATRIRKRGSSSDEQQAPLGKGAKDLCVCVFVCVELSQFLYL